MLRLSQRKICLFLFSEEEGYKEGYKEKIFDYARSFTVVID